MTQRLFQAGDQLRAIWALAERYGAVVVDEVHDQTTHERELYFPDKRKEAAFMREAARRGLFDV